MVNKKSSGFAIW